MGVGNGLSFSWNVGKFPRCGRLSGLTISGMGVVSPTLVGVGWYCGRRKVLLWIEEGRKKRRSVAGDDMAFKGGSEQVRAQAPGRIRARCCVVLVARTLATRWLSGGSRPVLGTSSLQMPFVVTLFKGQNSRVVCGCDEHPVLIPFLGISRREG